jgi:cytochrome c peroxidase
VSAALAASGCTAQNWTQGGTLAMADGHLFVASSDNGGVAVVDPSAKSGNIDFIATGERPEHIIASGDSVFVSNRQSRSVTQINAKSHRITRQIAAGAEPMGMAVTSDGILLVTNAMSGTLQAVRISDGKTIWTVPLNEEVRAVAAISGGLAWVPSYKSALMHVIDVRRGVETGTPIDMSATNWAGYQVRGVESITMDPSGTTAYLAHSESLATPLVDFTAATITVPIRGYYAQSVETAQVKGTPPIVPAVTAVSRSSVTSTSMAGLGSGVAGPKVVVFSPAGNYLYIAGYLANTLGIAAPGSSPETISVGAGPSGIVVTSDDTRAYVYNEFDHSISVVGRDDSGNASVLGVIVDVTPQTLNAHLQNGRLLFHAAADPRLSVQGTGGIACASCHPDGREDGHTWSFVEGVRNTPMLVGRHLEMTAPYHWDGQLQNPHDFSTVVDIRMGGTGLQDSDYDDIFAWLESEPAPDNPNRSANGTLTADQAAGQQIFASAGCSSCHVGPAFTDNLFWNVGVPFTTVALADAASGSVASSSVQPTNPNTPSLLGLFASAPYLHDGSKRTLEQRITENPGDVHGRTSQLSTTEVSQLVAYLKTL